MLRQHVLEDKLSIEHCQKVLKKSGLKYTNKEVEAIRDFFYQLASVEFEHYQNLPMEEKRAISDMGKETPK